MLLSALFICEHAMILLSFICTSSIDLTRKHQSFFPCNEKKVQLKVDLPAAQYLLKYIVVLGLTVQHHCISLKYSVR